MCLCGPQFKLICILFAGRYRLVKKFPMKRCGIVLVVSEIESELINGN